MRNHWTIASIADAVKERGIKVLETEYLGFEKHHRWQCKKGHIWKAVLRNVIHRKSGCPNCSGRTPPSMEEIHAFAETKGGRFLSVVFSHSQAKYEWECAVGHRWPASWAKVFRVGQWCPECGGKKRKDINWLQNLGKDRGFDCLSRSYVNNKAAYTWKCPIGSGHVFLASANNVYNGWGCPHCARKISKSEKKLFDIVRGVFPDAEGNRRGLLQNKRIELDIYIPSLSKAIEYDGDYWHSGDEAAARDVRKNALCLEAGIELLRVKDSEYKTNPVATEARVFDFLKAP